MCGLVGAVGFLEHKHRAVMKDLLFLDTLRGRDSTGLAVVDRDRSVKIRKLAMPGYEFIEYANVDKLMSHADQLWIGHNRFKTMGDATRANAHPFEVLDEKANEILLIGAHNGTLNNKFEIESKMDNTRYGTDSEALFNYLVQAPDFKTAINSLKGAWSLVFWDPTTDSLHFCRNKERPLVFAYTKDKKALFYASEAWMLVNACRRNGVDLLQNERGLSCYSTLEDHLYTIRIPQERNVELPDLIKEGGYSGAPSNNFQRQHYGYGWWNEQDDDFDQQEKSKEAAKGKEKTEATREEDERKVITIGHPKIVGFEGKELTKKEFDAICAKGCAWCASNIKGQAVGWLDDVTAVCADCIYDQHPKDGDRVHPDNDDPFDDDMPEDLLTKHTKEYKTLVEQAAASSQKKSAN
jgi:predicted glutamine amidotransferase